MSVQRRRRAPRGDGNRVEIEVTHPRGEKLEAFLRDQALDFMKALRLDGRELSLLVVTDRRIRALNAQWRGKDKATDVLSFPAGPPVKGTPKPHPLGDVVLSLDTAAREARARGLALQEEISRYLAHGLLHLLGYDHHRPGDAKEMARMERRLLGRGGMVADALLA